MLFIRSSRDGKALKWETELTHDELAARIARSRPGAALVELWSYPVETHVLSNNADGDEITLIRIPNRRHGMCRGPEAFAASPLMPVIVWHGLGISSDVWICSPTSTESNLAFLLADNEFDVWLANSRGNHHTKSHPDRTSLDEIAYSDIPAVVDYVLGVTRRDSVAYIGYSQGSAAICAALSINDELNDKISVAFCTAPALKPRPEAITNILLRQSLRTFGPHGLYTLLGRGALLPLTKTFRTVAPPFIYAHAMAVAFKQLFNWDCEKLGSSARREALFAHCFGGTSVKNVVHWFQIMNEDHHVHGSLHHYLEAIPNYSWLWGAEKFPSTRFSQRTTSKYPTKHIRTKLFMYCGTSDAISDFDHMKSHLPSHATLIKVQDYNHLDFLWAMDVKTKCWDHIISILDTRRNRGVRFAPDTKVKSPKYNKSLEAERKLFESEGFGYKRRDGVGLDFLDLAVVGKKILGRSEKNVDEEEGEVAEDTQAGLFDEGLEGIDGHAYGDLGDGVVPLEDLSISSLEGFTPAPFDDDSTDDEAGGNSDKLEGDKENEWVDDEKDGSIQLDLFLDLVEKKASRVGLHSFSRKSLLSSPVPKPKFVKSSRKAAVARPVE